MEKKTMSMKENALTIEDLRLMRNNPQPVYLTDLERPENDGWLICHGTISSFGVEQLSAGHAVRIDLDGYGDRIKAYGVLSIEEQRIFLADTLDRKLSGLPSGQLKVTLGITLVRELVAALRGVVDDRA